MSQQEARPLRTCDIVMKGGITSGVVYPRSDGGMCSNFPLHFFDAALPRRPTFSFEAQACAVSRFRCGTLKRGHNIKYLPHVFTQEGVAMLSSVLRSPRAVQVNIAIMRVFVRLRETLALHQELAHKLAELAQFLYINWRPADREQDYEKLLEACRPPAEVELESVPEQTAEKAVQLDYGPGCQSAAGTAESSLGPASRVELATDDTDFTDSLAGKQRRRRIEHRGETTKYTKHTKKEHRVF